MTKQLSPGISLSLLFAAGAVLAQTPPALPAFEVATVKPSAPYDLAAMRAGTAHIGTRIDASRVDIGTASLFRLICTAYRLKPYQVSGPEWLKTTTFDIQAKIPAGVTSDKVPEMLQTLLVERFGLKVHHDSKEQPVYALVVAQGGLKVKETAPEPAPVPPAAGSAGAPKPAEMSIPTLQGDVRMVRTAQGASIEMPGGEISGKIRLSAGEPATPPRIHVESSASMKTFAEMLSVGLVDRPVVDMTGLAGTYDLAGELSLEDVMGVARTSISFLPIGGGGGGDAGGGPAANLSDPSGSSVSKSLQNMGLKLDPRKLPLDMLVIDHIEKTPTEN